MLANTPVKTKIVNFLLQPARVLPQLPDISLYRTELNKIYLHSFQTEKRPTGNKIILNQASTALLKYVLVVILPRVISPVGVI
jgi:hypothetical protein